MPGRPPGDASGHRRGDCAGVTALRILVQLAVKYVMIGLISVLVLPAVASVTAGRALWAALAVTLFAYLVGDMLVLPGLGNAMAVLADFVLATLVYWVWPGPAIGFGAALVTGGAVAVAEILFHYYLDRRQPA